jgi:thiosulfate/3-mercaptopyruvate sulfurtransferase
MKTLKNITSLLVGLLLVQFVMASDFIEAKALAKIMNNDNVVLVSAQKAPLYQDFHITGSISLPPKDLTMDEPVPYMNMSATDMAALLGKKGISDKNTIILYDEGSHKYSGRLYWVLKYLGAQDVKILNGGIKAWQAARKPVSSTATKLPATTFTANVQEGYLATLDDVKTATASDTYVIIDARAETEYDGTNETSLRLGHIPTAINIEYLELMDANGNVKSDEALKIFYESKGVTSDKTVIIYCKSSVRAAIEFAALHSSLGYPNVKVFDGAFYQWEGEADLEVIAK